MRCEDIYRHVSGLALAAKCSQLLQIAWFLSSKLRVAGLNPAGVATQNTCAAGTNRAKIF
jgi:hypothetical protein